MAESKLSNDIALSWLLGGRSSKFYKLITGDAESGTNNLATTTTVYNNYLTLSNLIQTLGDTVEEMDVLVAALEANAVTTADLSNAYDYASGYNDGTYSEDELEELIGTISTTLLLKIVATAKSITESYSYATTTSLTTLGTTLEEYQTLMHGKIERGYITYNNTQYFGIAISSNISFTGTISTSLDSEENTYYEIDSGQTFGLYTSTGWMFFINGSLIGWFDSTDNSLHVGEETVEGDLVVDTDWKFTTNSAGFGLRYIGG